MIGARLQVPLNTTGKIPAVIILHGTSGVPYGGVYYAAALNRAGIATLEIDQWGGRGLPGGASSRPKGLGDNLPDVAGAYHLLAARSEIDAERIGLMGSSMGGIETLLMMTSMSGHRTQTPRSLSRMIIAACREVRDVTYRLVVRRPGSWLRLRFDVWSPASESRGEPWAQGDAPRPNELAFRPLLTDCHYFVISRSAVRASASWFAVCLALVWSFRPLSFLPPTAGKPHDPNGTQPRSGQFGIMLRDRARYLIAHSPAD